jgi:hypothetical protein
VTDSEVNKKLRKASLKLILLRDLWGDRPRQTPLRIPRSA